MDSKSLRTTKYVPELDGLRGIAVIVVLIFHANIPFPVGDKFLQGGFVGVDIFFVLSGFLITNILLFDYQTTGTVQFKLFFYRRLVRLAPAFWVLLATFCFFVIYFLNSEDTSRHLLDAAISALYLSNWARAFSAHPPDFLGHTWSLAVEQQYYLLWPIILLALLRKSSEPHKVFIPVVIMALLSWFLRICLGLNGFSISRLFNGLDTRLDGLMIGCATSVFVFYRQNYPKQIGILKSLMGNISVVSMICISAFLICGRWYMYWMHYFGFIVVELSVAFIIVDIYINPECRWRKFLVNGWLVWLGTISYGLYLWHYPIFRIISSYGIVWYGKLLIGILLTIIFSSVSYRLVELPLLIRR